MTFTPAQLHAFLPAETGTATWWVALSGGLDSTVLLQSLCALQLPVVIKAVHVNHQLSPFANDWQAQCAALCTRLGVAFEAHSVTVINSGKGIEDAAREARYAVFLRCLGAGDLLLTGHHADDQSETLLLRLMRGTGPRGLAAMAQMRALGEASLWRPLLHFSRAQLETYAKAEQLSWVEDESNTSEVYDRNFLRSQVMPLLQARWPEFQTRWQQTADLCAVNESMLEDLAEEDLARAELREERIGSSLSLNYLAGLSAPRRQNLLRYWLRLRGFTTPEQSHWQQLNRQFFSEARADASPDLSIGNLSLRLFRLRLYALPLAKLATLNVAAPSAWELSVAASIALATGGQIQAQFVSTTDALAAKRPLLRAECNQLDIRYRQGGERCQPAGRGHSQTLKKLLLEYEVEPWLRERLPLVFYRGDLVAVADYWVCEGFVAPAGEAGFALSWSL